MARQRTIKPEFWTSEQVGDCSTNARLMFIGLWNFADDRGVHPEKLKTIKGRIFPGDDISSEIIRGYIDELVSVGLLARYRVDDMDYLWVTGWDEHQKVDRPSYKYPDVPRETRKAAKRTASVRRTIGARHPPESESESEEKKDKKETPPPPSSPAAARASDAPSPGGGGGGNAAPKVEATSADAVAIIRAFDDARAEVFGPELRRPWPTSNDAVTAKRWIEAGATLELVTGVFQAMNLRWKAEDREPPGSLKAFEAWVAAAIREGKAPMAEPKPNGGTRSQQRQGNTAEYNPDQTEQRWRDRVRRFCGGGAWLEDQWGPEPTAKDTHVPAGILAEFVGQLPKTDSGGARP